MFIYPNLTNHPHFLWFERKDQIFPKQILVNWRVSQRPGPPGCILGARRTHEYLAMQNFEHAFLDFDFLRELTALETKHLYLVSTQDYSNNVVTTRMVMLRGISWTIGVGQGIPELSYRGMCGEPGKAPEAGSWKTILGPQVLFIIPLMLHTPFIEPHVITGRTKPSADDNAYVACILEQYGLPNPA